MKPASCSTCGIMLDLDAVPSHDRATNRVGKHCPCCHAPLCETALAGVTHEAANAQDGERDFNRKAQRVQAAKDAAATVASAEASPAAAPVEAPEA